MPSGVYKRILGVNCGLPSQSNSPSIETRKKISEKLMGIKRPYNKGHKVSEEHKKRLHDLKKGKIPLVVLRGDNKGEKHYKYIKDRSKLKQHDDRGFRMANSASNEWVKKVKNLQN